MSQEHPKTSGVSLGEKSGGHRKHVGHAIHKAGKYNEAEHAASGNLSGKVERPAHKAPSGLPRKAGA